MIVFDNKSVRRNRMKAMGLKKPAFFLMDWAIDNICDRLEVIKRDFATSLVFGHRASKDKIQQLQSVTSLNTIVQADCAPLPKTYGHKEVSTLVAEADILPFKSDSFDAIINIMTLHSVNDLPGALIQVNRVLKADGLFIGCFFGGETLFQLRESFMHVESQMKNGVSPRISPFADKQQVGALMQRAGFALPVIDSEIVTVTYENAFALMHDLRHMGEGNSIAARQKQNPGKDFMTAVAEHYQRTYTDSDGRIEANFEIIFTLGWAPHESQQQPLKRGSSEVRLADILDTNEISTGALPEG
jgi:SAM-dependent methyltransferase